MNSRGGVNAPGATADIDGQGGGWETIEKKSKKSGQPSGKQWAQWGSSSNAAPVAWGPTEGAAQQAWGANGSSRTSGNNRAQPADHRPAGRVNPRPPPQTKTWEAELQAARPVVPPPLAHGWQWKSRPHPSGSESKKDEVPSSGYDPEMYNAECDNLSDDDHDDDMSDDDMSDEYDSDASEKSFETRKNNKWFKGFFEALDKLTVDQINEQPRQWHCPACKDGPGAIDWYKGLHPLMAHAKTKGATRVKLHRELAALLEEELSRRGTSVIPSGEQYGKWKGLRETTDTRQIVWPPMVIVMNTLLEKNDDDKWIGMGNQELLDYFSGYAASKARHAYGPAGHRGMSVLIFESSAMGFMEAERLHMHFVDQGTDKDAWQYRKVPFLPGGERQLYGFLASKEDLETFNKHCQGKSRLKYDMKSYNEMVVIPMKKMSEDNQQLNHLKNKVVKTEQHSKAVQETLGVISQKLRETMKENKTVRSKTKQHHEEINKEMDYQQELIERIHEATEEKERMFDKLLQEERAKAKLFCVDSGSGQDRKLREEEIQRFIDCQVKGVEEFESERVELIKAHEEKKFNLKKEYMTKEVQLEEEFHAALTALMDKYKPDSFQASSS